MADRFYCPSPWIDGRARLEGDEARHLSRVRRGAVGDRVGLFDGLGRSAVAEVAEIGRDRVELTIVETSEADAIRPAALVLATAVPKGDRFDWLVEKATELGVTRLVPLITERSVVDPRSAKVDRLRRLVIEASKQSGRNRLMEIAAPTPMAAWLSKPVIDVGTYYVAHPSGLPLADGTRPERRAGFAVMVGPEGGFSGDEMAAAVRAGYRPVNLGPTILRVETAALAACAATLIWAE